MNTLLSPKQSIQGNEGIKGEEKGTFSAAAELIRAQALNAAAWRLNGRWEVCRRRQLLSHTTRMSLFRACHGREDQALPYVLAMGPFFLGAVVLGDMCGRCCMRKCRSRAPAADS